MSDQATQQPSLWGQVETISHESGVATHVCEIETMMGWKVFVTGFEGDETFFPYTIYADENETMIARATARAKANQFVASNGLGKNPIDCYAIRVRKDAVLGEEPFLYDQWFIYFFSDPLYHEKVVANMKRLGMNPSMKTWAKIECQFDRTKKPKRKERQLRSGGQLQFNEDGSPKMGEVDVYPYIAWPVEVYASREAAEKAVAASEVAVAGTVQVVELYPEGYDKESWAYLKDAIRQARDNEHKTPDALSKDFMLSVPWILRALNN